jgi:hypothetical protein
MRAIRARRLSVQSDVWWVSISGLYFIVAMPVSAFIASDWTGRKIADGAKPWLAAKSSESAAGQTRTSRDVRLESASPPSADIARRGS